jgi:hypothetical protein
MAVVKPELLYLSNEITFLQNSKGHTYISGVTQLDQDNADILRCRPAPEVAMAVARSEAQYLSEGMTFLQNSKSSI